MKGAVSHQKFLLDLLRKDERFREAYLNEALNEEESCISLGMFRNVAEAMGGITRLSKTTGLNRQNLYKALSGKKDPAYSTVEGIVHGFGFRIKVEPVKNAKKDGMERLNQVVQEEAASYSAKVKKLKGSLSPEDAKELRSSTQKIRRSVH